MENILLLWSKFNVDMNRRDVRKLKSQFKKKTAQNKFGLRTDGLVPRKTIASGRNLVNGRNAGHLCLFNATWCEYRPEPVELKKPFACIVLLYAKPPSISGETKTSGMERGLPGDKLTLHHIKCGALPLSLDARSARRLPTKSTSENVSLQKAEIYLCYEHCQ